MESVYVDRFYKDSGNVDRESGQIFNQLAVPGSANYEFEMFL